MENDTKKVYTAKEMRKAAATLYKRGDKLMTEEMLAFSAMLRQAAKMSERCVKMRDKYGCWSGIGDKEVDAIIDTVDFVQLGKEN